MFAAVTLSGLISEFTTVHLAKVIEYTIAIGPIVLACFLAKIFWTLWMRFVRAEFYLSLKYAVLEVRLPKEQMKSPLAMEVFLNSIHNTSDGSKYVQLWKGESRPYYSLEIVSIEGRVKFYIWCEDRRKQGVMNGLYSQFPGIEVHDVEDYTRGTHYDPKTMKMWAAEFKFLKPDPYPIKTYVDYGMDKDPKEELKVDPMAPLIEFLGSVGPNQQVWIQIPVVAHKKKRKPGHLFLQTDMYEDEAKSIVNKIMIRDPKTKVSGERDEVTGFTKLPSISKGEQEIVEAIERAQSKHLFDCGIRALYIAKKEFFNTPFGIGGCIGSMKQFSSGSLNGFKPRNKWHVKFNGHPWEDFRNMRRDYYSRDALAAYKRRSFFFPPFESEPIVMNTEEIATIYHFPGTVSMTPTLERVPSKKGQAPVNLPL